MLLIWPTYETGKEWGKLLVCVCQSVIFPLWNSLLWSLVSVFIMTYKVFYTSSSKNPVEADIESIFLSTFWIVLMHLIQMYNPPMIREAIKVMKEVEKMFKKCWKKFSLVKLHFTGNWQECSRHMFLLLKGSNFIVSTLSKCFNDVIL